MKNLIKILYILNFLLPVCTQGQTVTWQKWYDYNNYDDQGVDIVQTFDNSYLALSNNYIINSDKFSVLKLNAFGNIEWQKIYDDSLINHLATGIQQTLDSNFIISGYNSSKMFLLKINKFGIPVWIKYFAKPGADVRCHSLKITIDNKIISCGSVLYISPNKWNSYILKTDSFGNKEWDNEFSDSLFSSASDVIETKSNRFYLSGSTVTNTFSGDYYCFVKNIDSKGKLIWNQVFGKKKYGNNIVLNSDNKLYVAGRFDSNGVSSYLSKLDTNGNIIFQKSYNQNRGIAMCSTESGKLILSGASSFRLDSTSSTYVIGFAKIDTNGSLIFSNQVITTFGDYYSGSSKIRQTSDNGFIIIGQTDYPFTSNTNTLVVKSDSLGNAPKIVGVQNSNSEIPELFTLYQNYPNPFNSSTIISYKLNFPGTIKIKVIDILGKSVLEVANGFQDVGIYLYELNLDKSSSGIYFCILMKDEIILDKKMMLLLK